MSETAKYYKFNGANKITIYEEKLSKLKDTLPPSAIVGYITNKHDEEFYLTQYALAPRYIVKNMDLPLVIGNFQTPPEKNELRQYLPLILAEDFENGLILFKKGPLK